MRLLHGALHCCVPSMIEYSTTGRGEGSSASQLLPLLQELNEQQLKKQKDQQSQLDALTAKLESGEVTHLGVCGFV